MCSLKHHPIDLNIMSNIVLTSSNRNTTLFIMFHNYSHIAFGLLSIPWASCHHFAPRAPCAHCFFSSSLGCRYLARLLQTYHRAVQNIKGPNINGNEIVSSDRCTVVFDPCKIYIPSRTHNNRRLVTIWSLTWIIIWSLTWITMITI